MELETLANIAEIFGMIVVAVTLIFLTIQMRQNNKALQHSSYQSVLGLLESSDRVLAKDIELLHIVQSAHDSPNDISSDDWLRFKHYAFPHIGIWEYLYLANLDSTLSRLQWLAFEPYFLETYSSQGFKRFWRENRSSFAQEFASYVEGELPHLRLSS